MMAMESEYMENQLKRCSQILVVMGVLLSLAYSGIIFVFIYVYLLLFRFHYLYLIPLFYFAWTIYDFEVFERGGRRWEWFRRLKIWKYFADYFSTRIVKTCELDPSNNYIMLYHPHGIMCLGMFSCFVTEAANFMGIFPGIVPRFLLQNALLFLPFTREQFAWYGGCSVSKKSIEWLLTKEGRGNAVILAAGGAEEALEAHPGSATLILKNRKGFVKLALKYGASLVPMFVFGENENFYQIPNSEGSYLRRIQNMLRKMLKFAIPLYYGRIFCLLPFGKPITVVVGKPIELEIDTAPTSEKVDAIHQMYIERLTELFEEHKPKYGPHLQLKLK